MFVCGFVNAFNWTAANMYDEWSAIIKYRSEYVYTT